MGNNEALNEVIVSGETVRNILLIIIIAAIVYMAVYVMMKRGKLSKINSVGSTKKLERCAELGLTVMGKVVEIQTVNNNELRVSEHDRYHKRRTPKSGVYMYESDYVIKDRFERAVKSIDDGRVSYKPVIRYKVGDKIYTQPYHRYIDERKFRIKDGENVRIIYCKSNPRFYILHNDTESYRYLNYILGGGN